MKDGEPTADLNVVILPDEEVNRTLIEWSDQVSSRYPSNFRLNTDNRLPHLSLYSARYPVRNQEELLSKVGRVANATDAFDVTLTGFTAISGYLFYDVEMNGSLKGLHENVVDSLNALREGQITDIQSRLTGLSPEQERARAEYGYISAKKLYAPHFTVTHFPNPEHAVQAKAMLPDRSLSMRVRQLGVAPFGDYGTCPQPLRRFALE